MEAGLTRRGRVARLVDGSKGRVPDYSATRPRDVEPVHAVARDNMGRLRRDTRPRRVKKEL